MIKRGGTFLNLGSYDGITNDPILHYIRNYDLSGYFVDANDDVLELCKNNFRGPQFQFENIGINLSSGAMPFFKPKKIENVPDWFSQTGSFSLHEIKKICHELKIGIDSYETVYVSCETISEFIEKRHLFDLEVLNIDLEGLDEYVIRLFPFNKVKPKVIIIEISHKDGLDHETYNFIVSQGYHSNRIPITNWSIEFSLDFNFGVSV